MEKKATRKLLILTSRFPYPLEKGDKLRLYHQIKYLSKRFQIVLVSLCQENINSSHREELSSYCSKIHCLYLDRSQHLVNLLQGLRRGWPMHVSYFYSSRIGQKMTEIIRQESPDLIFCQLIRMAGYLKNTDCPAAIDYMDAFSLRVERQARQSKWLRWFWRREARLLQRFEQRVQDRFQFKYIIAPRDQDHLKNLGVSKTTILSNGVDSGFFKPDNSVVKDVDIAFVGNMSYYPNAQAAQYLVEKVVPQLRKSNKKLKILIAGASPSRTVRSLASSNVEVTGHLDDIRKAYARCKLFIAPIFAGSGQQNKILEAMSMEIPCLTTAAVRDSIGAGEDLLPIAADPETFAALAQNFLANPSKRQELGRRGREFVTQHFVWTVCCKPLDLLTKDEIVLEHG